MHPQLAVYADRTGKDLAWRHLLRRLLPFVHAIVAHHGGDPDPVIAKDPVVPGASITCSSLMRAVDSPSKAH